MSRTAAAPPGAIAHELRTALGRLGRHLRTAGELPLAQVIVLDRLDGAGPQTTSGLAAAERVRPQSMAQTVAELERAQLIVRRPDPRDRRQVLLDLTAEGRIALSAERRTRDHWLAQLIDERLDAEERETLMRAAVLLGRLT
jgi:DNA-binding MarR family transcriptional regulator